MIFFINNIILLIIGSKITDSAGRELKTAECSFRGLVSWLSIKELAYL